MKKRLLDIVKDDFVRGDNGFWSFSPKVDNRAYAAHELYIIADELDRLNKVWERDCNKQGETNENI